MKRPIFILVFLAFICIFICENIKLDIYLILFFISISVFILFIKKDVSLYYFYFILLFFIYLIFINQESSEDKNLSSQYQATIIQRQKKEDDYQYILKVKNESISGIKAIFNDENYYKIGHELTLKGKLEKVLTSKNYKSFDYSKYLKSKGIRYNFYGQVTDYKTRFSIYNFRNIFKDFIEKNTSSLSKKSSNFAKSIILGENFIEKEDLSLYQNLGLAHMLAISGLHINIIIKIFEFIFYYISIKRKYFNILVSIILLIYGFLIGFPVSLLRAFLTYIISAFSIHFGIFYDSLNIVGLVMFILLMINPYYVYTAGFWFSFLAIISINMFNDKIRKIFRIKSFVLSKFTDTASISLGMLPVQVYMFNKLNLLSILMNLFAVPLAIIPVMFSFICGFGLNKILFFSNFILDVFLRILDYYTELLSNFDILNLNFPSYDLIILVFFYFFLLFSLYFNNFSVKIKKKVFKLSMIFIIFYISFVNLKYQYFNTRVNFIDVGQGDAILIRSGENNILLDTGGNFKNPQASAKNLYQYLYKNGVKKLDAILISHDDYDHMGNLIFLSKQINIGQIYVGPYFPNDKIESLLKENLKVKKVKKGNYLDLKKAKMKVVFEGDNEDGNESSVVYLLESYNKKVLFTGDLETNENNINTDKIDVLKVSHHGSKNATSEEFIKKTQPEYSVISVGANNRYGHPSPEVIERLKKNDINIYRTDTDGNIQLSIGPFGYMIESYNEKTSIFNFIFKYIFY